MFNLAMKILGPCTLVQAALPDMLEKTPKEFHQQNIAVFEVTITAQESHVYRVLYRISSVHQ